MNEKIDQPFPKFVFGEPDRNLVAQFQREIMEVEGAPAEFVAPFLLGALSAAAARGLEVESHNGKYSRGNIYIALEAESGVGKSETGRHTFGPLFDYEAEARQGFQEDQRPHLEAKIRIIEAQLRKAESSGSLSEAGFTGMHKEKQKLEKCLCGPRYLVEDCTQEALEKILSEQDGVTSLISSDARKVVKNILGRHRNGSAEEDIFIKAWSGDPFSVDRITRSSIAPVRDPCLSVFIALQPDLFQQLLRPDLVESGFFPRLLPARAIEGFTPNCSSRGYNPEVTKAYGQHIRSAFDFYRKAARPFRFPMAPEARTTMDWFFNMAVELAKKDPAMASCYRRWAEQACRIAVCLQIAFFGREAHMQPLHGYCAQKAVELMLWFGAQQRELLQGLVEGKKKALADKLLDLVQQHPAGISVRDCYKKLHSSKAEIMALLNELSQLELISVSTGGRPSDVVRMKHATPGL